MQINDMVAKTYKVVGDDSKTSMHRGQIRFTFALHDFQK